MAYLKKFICAREVNMWLRKIMTYLKQFLGEASRLFRGGPRGNSTLGPLDSITVAQRFPYFVGMSTAYSASATQLVFNRPPGVELGDLLLAVVVIVDNTNVAYPMIYPANWNREDYGLFGVSSQHARNRFVTYAGSSEPSTYTFQNNNGGTNRIMSGVLVAYRDAHRSAPGLPPPFSAWSITETAGDDFQAPDAASSLLLGPVWLDEKLPQKTLNTYIMVHGSVTPVPTINLNGGNETTLIANEQHPKVTIALVEEIVLPGAYIDPGDAGWDTAYEGALTADVSVPQAVDWGALTMLLSKP
jgi:hypothetical protein